MISSCSLRVGREGASLLFQCPAPPGTSSSRCSPPRVLTVFLWCLSLSFAAAPVRLLLFCMSTSLRSASPRIVLRFASLRLLSCCACRLGFPGRAVTVTVTVNKPPKQQNENSPRLLRKVPRLYQVACCAGLTSSPEQSNEGKRQRAPRLMAGATALNSTTLTGL